MITGGRIPLVSLTFLSVTALRRQYVAARPGLAAALIAVTMLCGASGAQAQRGGMGGYSGPRPTNGMIGIGGGIGTGGGFAVHSLGTGVMSGIGANAVVSAPGRDGPDGVVRHERRTTRSGSAGQKSGNSPRTARRGPGGAPPSNETRYVPDEVLIEVAGDPSIRVVDGLAARHRLSRVESQRIGLTDSTWFRWRISDRRSVTAVIRDLETDGVVRWAQPNYLFALEEVIATDSRLGESPEPDRSVNPADEAGDPAQYALARLHLPEAQVLSRGKRVVVAVIDTEVDKTNPEFGDAILESYDALGGAAPMEAHGTGIAGTIAAHARLLGAAPDVRILAIRAFGGGQGSTFAIVKGLDFAVSHGARVVNMSFSGPADPALSRAAAAAHGKGAVLIAAAGNHGPNGPAAYPAADPSVIAVTATDANDRLFEAANRGDYIAVAAPGVDILVPAPRGIYVMSSGTSFASAFVSGTAALLVERKPDITPDAVKKALTSTAHDLGAKGRDDQFGAGLIDANQALLSLEGRPAAELRPPASH